MALHDLAGDRAELILVAPDPDFLYRPLLVEEPSTSDRRSSTRSSRWWKSWAPILPGAAKSVTRTSTPSSSATARELEYDFLIVARGGRFHPA